MDLPTTMMAEERRKFNLQQQEVENALQVKDSWDGLCGKPEFLG